MKHINIPSEIKVIEEQTFYGCISLEVIDNIQNLVNNETDLSDYVFAHCNIIRDNKAYSDLLIELNENGLAVILAIKA